MLKKGSPMPQKGWNARAEGKVRSGVGKRESGKKHDLLHENAVLKKKRPWNLDRGRLVSGRGGGTMNPLGGDRSKTRPNLKAGNVNILTGRTSAPKDRLRCS